MKLDTAALMWIFVLSLTIFVLLTFEIICTVLIHDPIYRTLIMTLIIGGYLIATIYYAATQ